MKKRNLTKEKIIQIAFSLADEIGLDKVTFQKLAEKLDIKSPSLYNHFSNMSDLKISMTTYLLNSLNFKLMQDLVGKSGEAAVKIFAYTYKDFAMENKTAYRLFLSTKTTENEEVNRMAKETNNIILQVLSFYIKNDVDLIHKSRALRSLLHGYVSLSSLGYFQNKVDSEDSFRIMIDDFILSLSKNT
ncbi:AcrR family transcriptional regulator [Clostridium acetobutylicum]|uniref:HTH transcriptional regulator TetR family n=1 Tax=Clostridium acetobutylicum (strain ATCC 824 / DSM 792 / JCM 1419 / IAM 19013 / LMG 5710 / NBRC 13948 / NRRL B-527 / VKM B-1787 / 2291 / W) TaxID=272562 RepID=Q97TR9_CLOAB|nr:MULTISPECIES: TetR-like C-terminal domain-containing protein [Clostridium]AAK76774.1 HTH transcriptional regulator TetR family [Clostridium acetobutylicum ATCC 824]AEI34770.1 TetR family transcriptional regulator [Clostridium acetobutylicum DSM 1731]AWV82319.1 TetR/AcrR family transcriptional regulator [Clostridium acetobutylicum]MBC2396017.1 TetR/AcrR family transcriptional regulator [Clostridium acetobutylicum]MBC2584911.1 TetR/AcrR family transcriptional regulator [Clostridium acetobutyl